MNYDHDENQKILKKAARDFLSKECPKSLVRDMAKDETGHPVELWRKMAKLGWMGLGFPESYGGTGGSYLDLIVLLEEMGRALLPGPFFSSIVLGGLTLLETGSQPQKKKLLPKVLTGETILTLALTEKAATYSPESIKAKAVFDGNSYVISGTKLFVPDVAVADYIICAVRTTRKSAKGEGITLFLVKKSDKGVRYAALETMAGDKQFEVVLDRVKVPKENILGKVDMGWDYLKQVLKMAAVAKCADLVGGAQMALETAVTHAKERIQFGRPIGSFQAVQHHCANMLTNIETSRFITYEAAWKLSENLPCDGEVAMAKAWSNEACMQTIALAHQIHGGMGFTEEHDMPLYYRRTREGILLYGDTDYHREMLAQAMGL